MKIIVSTSNNPYLNLACEEYLFTDRTEDIVFIYQNSPSVIVGKHQNAFREINSSFLEENNIPVLRRLSGGGTVYHDLGNINIALFRSHSENKLVKLKKLITPINFFLKTLHPDIEMGEKNEFRINGKKISGSAMRTQKNRTLCHCTLLLDSNLETLQKAITPDVVNITDKAIESIRAEVTNLLPYLCEDYSKTDVEKVKEKIIDYFLENNWGSTIEIIQDEEQTRIKMLQEEKYMCWDWNYGYSPMFEFEQLIEINHEMTTIKLIIKDGKVSKISFDNTNDRNDQFYSILRDFMSNKNFHNKLINSSLNQLNTCLFGSSFKVI